MVGSSIQWVQQQKDLFPKVSREKQGTVSRGVKRAQHPRGTVWMKKVRNAWWHTVLIYTLKAETSNLRWKPVECSEQRCCTCMPVLTVNKLGCIILYALKRIQDVVMDTSKKRITVVYPRENERNSKFVGIISGQEGADFFQFYATDRI